MPTKQKYHGYHTANTPDEQIAAQLWQEENERHGDVTLLAKLLGGTCPRNPTEREYVTVATVIQWLGTAEGQEFTRDLIRHWGRRKRASRKMTTVEARP
jgi:hypothetical protein